MTANKIRIEVKVEGIAELEQSLSELKTSVAKRAVKKALFTASRPIVERAKQLVPVDEGELRNGIMAGGTLKNNAGKQAFHDVMASGGSQEEALSALRDARREAKGEKSNVEIYVGVSSKVHHATLVEFGTSHSAPQPFIRPAFESEKENVLALIKTELRSEIDKAAARAAKRAAKLAAKAS